MLIITFLQQEFVLLPEFQNLDVIGEEAKVHLIDSFRKTRWLSFAFPPIILAIRLSLVSICLFLGSFFFSEMNGVQYSKWWKVAISAQSVMLVYSCILCIINICTGENRAMEISSSISLLCLAREDTATWIKIPLSAFNIFEIAYWCVLSLCVGKLVGTNFSKSFKFVMSSYGVGYLFYIALLMFLMLYLA